MRLPQPPFIIISMPGLTKFSVSEIAASLDQPFSVADVAYVDDILVGVYVCEGTLQRHKHLDIDELFWVYDGAMQVESERGDVRLESDELTVVPKGTRHRSRSTNRATVLLLRCGFLPDRKNGKRRLYAVEDAGLPCLNIRSEAEKLAAPFRFHTIAQVEDSMIRIGRGSGRWPVELPVAHDRMFYVVDGRLTVRTVRDRLRLEPGDFTIVSRGAFYHLHSADDTLLVQVTRGAL